MAAISVNNTNILTEETQTKAAVGESVAQRIGGANNWHNNYSRSVMVFEAAGTFSSFSTSQLTDVQVHMRTHDFSIASVSMLIVESGTAGTIECDVRYIRDQVDQGSIFSTRPSISFNAGDFSYVAREIPFSGLGSETTGSSTAGTKTLPVLGTTDFNAFDIFTMDITSTGTSSASVQLIIETRAR